jgi:Type IV secretory pathway, VirD4 components
MPLGAAVWTLVTAGAFAWWVQTDDCKRLTARLTAPLRRHAGMSEMGQGGSASFAGMVAEWGSLYGSGSILLGRSLYRRGTVIGSDDDRGLLTIAGSRSGKGRSAIIPNLITWGGSVVVIDPKGTNAAVTAARRGKGGGRVTDFLGQEVHILDPFGVVKGVQSAAFNPLSVVDLKSPTAREDLGLIADALIVRTGGQDSHWDESAHSIVLGMMAQVLTDNPAASLVDLRAVLKSDPDKRDDFFNAMLYNPAAGGVAKAAAAQVLAAGENERGGLLSTVLRNTAWLDSEAVGAVLSRSSFAMGELKNRPMSVYLVLPPHLLQEHRRFLRLFVNLTVRAVSEGGRGRVPVLLLMDEFYSLGPLDVIEKASGLLAGYGLKLWPIVQNVTQLQDLYPRNWQTFFANAGAVQLFGVNDRQTAQEITGALGKAAWLETVEDRQMRVISDLLESDEVGRMLGRDGGLQIVTRSGAAPLLLRKMNYDADPFFQSSQFNPDPDYS